MCLLLSEITLFWNIAIDEKIVLANSSLHPFPLSGISRLYTKMLWWWQVSDQLIEINGEPTVGMTHAQAVEHIRSGGSRIHLVLKRGNGFIPDYGMSMLLCISQSILLWVVSKIKSVHQWMQHPPEILSSNMGWSRLIWLWISKGGGRMDSMTLEPCTQHLFPIP